MFVWSCSTSGLERAQVCKTDIRPAFAAYKQGEQPWRIFGNKPDNGLYVAPAVQRAVRKEAPDALPLAIPYQFFKQHCNMGDWVLVVEDRGARTQVAARALGLYSVTLATSDKTVLFSTFDSTFDFVSHGK